jgi:hypothetical protein
VSVITSASRCIGAKFRLCAALGCLRANQVVTAAGPRWRPGVWRLDGHGSWRRPPPDRCSPRRRWRGCPTDEPTVENDSATKRHTSSLPRFRSPRPGQPARWRKIGSAEAGGRDLASGPCAFRPSAPRFAGMRRQSFRAPLIAGSRAGTAACRIPRCLGARPNERRFVLASSRAFSPASAGSAGPTSARALGSTPALA